MLKILGFKNYDIPRSIWGVHKVLIKISVAINKPIHMEFGPSCQFNILGLGISDNV